MVTENGMEYAAVLPADNAMINGTMFMAGEFIEFDRNEGTIEISNTLTTAIDIIFQQINSEAPLLKERSRNAFPQGLEEIVAQTLRKDPQERQHSMMELHDQLTEVVLKQKKTTTTATPGDLRNSNSSLSKALLACCAILVTIIVTMNTYLITPGLSRFIAGLRLAISALLVSLISFWVDSF